MPPETTLPSTETSPADRHCSSSSPLSQDVAVGVWEGFRVLSSGKGPPRAVLMLGFSFRELQPGAFRCGKLAIFETSLEEHTPLGRASICFLVFEAQDGKVFRVQLTTFLDGTEEVVLFAARPRDAAH